MDGWNAGIQIIGPFCFGGSKFPSMEKGELRNLQSERRKF